MKAIVLAAGLGSRLRPFTDATPKCMVPIGGEPLLTSTLSSLAAAGVDHTTVVVGHLESVIREAYGRRFDGMAIDYVSNPHFATTSNLVSLWLARGAMDDDCLLLEGDLRFDPALIVDLVRHPAPNVAAVDDHTPDMDGTVILPRGDHAAKLVLKRDQGPSFDYRGALKTVNIYKLSGASLRDVIVPNLQARVGADHTGQYYESAFAELLAEGRLQLALHHMGDQRWAEVDDEADWLRAEALFAPLEGLKVGA
jgi:NDP-sugar pyrophosphorylase family protein